MIRFDDHRLVTLRLPKVVADLIDPPYCLTRPPVTSVAEAEVWLRQMHGDAWPSLEVRMRTARRLMFAVYLRHMGHLFEDGPTEQMIARAAAIPVEMSGGGAR